MSKIEKMIDEIEEYIENCKSPVFQSGKIICDKEEMEELLAELKKSAPEEIAQVRKIVANKDAILNDAKQKAELIIKDAANQTTQILSEHQIMLQAYEQADEIVASATGQAQQILDKATIEANQVRDAAMAYTDKIMADIENLLIATMEANSERFEGLQGSLDHYYQIVRSNRSELNGTANNAQGDGGAVASGATGEINLDMI